jgi:DNA-binding transcriptional regulator GbsR (MarR family)
MPRIDPENVGWKGRDTSAAAARSIAPRVGTLKAQVLACLDEAKGPLTADEIAEMTGGLVVSIRPRLSELANAGVVKDSGLRRDSAYGNQQVAWVLAA